MTVTCEVLQFLPHQNNLYIYIYIYVNILREVLENVSRLLRLFNTHMNVVQDGVYATIDGVVPSLMQLQVSLEKVLACYHLGKWSVK